jgi:hypothetical protein
MNGYSLDLIGERFGRLVVTAKAEDKIYEKSGKHKSQWYCDCDCGTKNKIILGVSLTSGSTKSCGCLHKEISSITAKTKISHGKKYNEYDLSGKYGVGYTYKGEEFYFDLEDYDKIKDICWYLSVRGYVVGHCLNTSRPIKMHQIILPTDDKHIADHINTNMKHDNRKSNLRVATQQENTRNRKISSNNTSGHRGVSYDKRNKKWLAYIGHNHKHINLGTYNNFDDAVKAREEAEEKYFGEFAYKEFN